MKVLSEPLTLSAPESTSSDLTLDLASHQGLGGISQEDTASVHDPQQVSQDAKKQGSVFSVFSSTFLTIFLAEIGDKTQITTLLMSAESHSPWVVFAGAGTALVATSLIGVLLGQWLASRVSQKTLEKAAAVTLLIISATLFWDVLH